LKIYYCSRTHSQLTQFITELRRVNLPPTIDNTNAAEDAEKADIMSETLKHLSLGSRKNLCINQKVSALSNVTSINERCLELQQPNTSIDHKCPFLPTKENQTLVNDFRDHAIAKIRDIEDLGKLGKTLGICPYYASRSAVKPSEIVTLPYPLLLQKSARDALNISLKDHVIIIDEAHNLMDAIANVNSITLSLSHLQSSMSKVTAYAEKFKKRLKGKNRAYVTQLLRLISSVTEALQKSACSTAKKDGTIPIETLMSGKGVDQINPHKLSRFLHESKLARKVEGYTTSQEEKERGPNVSSANTPVLLHVQNFLLTLMNPSDEGRMFFNKQGNEVYLRYTLLDPTNHFREIVEDARAVILAGGTMSPVSLSSTPHYTCAFPTPLTHPDVRLRHPSIPLPPPIPPADFQLQPRNPTLKPHRHDNLLLFLLLALSHRIRLHVRETKFREDDPGAG
jgi:chromosome transmission fidelity protein 1